jgi:hypothetical protein
MPHHYPRPDAGFPHGDARWVLTAICSLEFPYLEPPHNVVT